jgi:hypothetical protein
MIDDEERAQRIARLNDEFRRQAGLTATIPRIAPGRYVMTAGIARLGQQARRKS